MRHLIDPLDLSQQEITSLLDLADHICADLSQTDPRYFPTSDLLWASPECTNHSRAKGRKRDTLQGDLFDQRVPDEAAERSRATMWDVVRFTEHHQYQAIMVENVVEAADWLPFKAWLMAMDALGYDHQFVSLNSMHAQAAGMPAPQSRDRMYVIFHRKGNARPDLEAMQRPAAYCADCGEIVRARQSWKKPGTKIGRYRSQYVYRCPNAECRHAIVEPAWLPAASIIDWSITGQRIGDRARPLAEKTRRRIAAGIARYWTPPTDKSKALAIPVGSTWSDKAIDTGREPWPTFTTNDGTGLVMRQHDALITSYYGNADGAQLVTQALPTVTTADRHALIMRNNNNAGDQSSMTTPAWEAFRTITTAGHQSLLTPGDIEAAAAHVDDVMFRMLEPHEVKGAMAFPADYVILGNRREQVRMCGNAVTPPAARDLVATVIQSLGDAA